MAKEFDFKKGKKQTAFKTPMLTSKVSPGKARLAGKAAAEKVRNPQGNSYGFDAGLSFALPLGKLAKAVGALSKAGRVAEAGAVDARLLAKAAGKQTARTGGSTINDVAMRNQSTSVFPRSSATKVRTAPNRILELQGQKQAAEARAFGRAAAKEISKNSKTPKMNPQQAQDSYERVSDLIRGGQSAKAVAKKIYPKTKFGRGK